MFLLPISISSFIFKTTFFKVKKTNDLNTIIIHLVDKDLYLDLDDYVIGVVAAEMPASFNDEALKAQAVASRSYAMNKINNNLVTISSSINDQVYKTNYELYEKWKDKYNNYYKKIENAILETKDEVITRDNKILKTFYFSMSNGKTENSESVFNEKLFVSVDSPYENKLPNFQITKNISEEELKRILNLSNIEIENIEKNETDHVKNIKISGKTISGIEFRKLLNLRSTDFSIIRKDNSYEITTKGYGHGVGMSQYGANEMAKMGYNYRQIIEHYYQNTEINKI